MGPWTPYPLLGGHLTALSLVALGLAIALGIAGFLSGGALIRALAAGLAPVGGLWVSALRMTVVPLVLTLLLTAITGPAEGRSMGRLGARTFALFLAFLGTVSVASILVMSRVVGWAPADPEVAARILSGTAIPSEAAAVAATGATSLAEGVTGLIPTNVFATAAGGTFSPFSSPQPSSGWRCADLWPMSYDELARMRRIGDFVKGAAGRT